MTEQPELTETQPGADATPPADTSSGDTSTASAAQPPLPSMNLRGSLSSIGRSLVINGAVPTLNRLQSAE